jgi:hypothetical protein
MADRTKIADLWGDYGAGNDQRDFDLLESCFTEDASFTVHIAGGDTVGPLQPRKDVMEFYGIDGKTQISRFEEAIALVREAWSGAELNHRGKHFTATGKISPVPPGAELWLGAMSDGGGRPGSACRGSPTRCTTSA